MSRQSVSQVLARNQMPSLDMLWVLAHELHISLNWIVTGEEAEAAPARLPAATEHSGDERAMAVMIQRAVSGPHGDQRRARLEGYLASLVAQAVDDEVQAAAAAEASHQVPRRRTA